MEEKIINAILLELQKLNGRFDHMEEEIQNRFALMDARFNTLEEIVLTMQADIVSLQDRMTSLENRISKLEATVENLQNTISQVVKKMQKFEDRLNTLEKITLRMECTFHDKISVLFDAHSYHNDQYQELDSRIRQNEIKIANLSLSNS